MRVIDFVIAGYLAGAILMAVWAYSRLRDPWHYRLICSATIGAFWPLPAAIIAFLAIEGWITGIVDWFNGK